MMRAGSPAPIALRLHGQAVEYYLAGTAVLDLVLISSTAVFTGSSLHVATGTTAAVPRDTRFSRIRICTYM